MSGTFLIGLRWRCAGALILLTMAAGPSLGGDLTERLLDDARDGQLNEFNFVTAALIAGGIDDECELQGWLDRYLDRREGLLSSLPTSDPREQWEQIHDALNQQFLTGQYDAAASDLRLTLDHGDFNCLTSLTVYLDLCQACELPVQVWLARGHVFLRAAGEGGPVDIEPGTPEWNSRAVIRRSGLRQISLVELLGKFFYNRGVELLKSQQFAEGIELVRASLDLDPEDFDARANLVAGLNNWAVDYVRTGRYEDAAGLIEQGLFFDPSFAPLIANEQLVRVKRAGR